MEQPNVDPDPFEPLYVLVRLSHLAALAMEADRPLDSVPHRTVRPCGWTAADVWEEV